MNVFITGGAGYVGSGLAPRLMALNEIEKVTILTRDLKKIPPARLKLLKNCELITGDIRNCDFNLNNIDVIIHLAGNYDIKWCNDNSGEAFEVFVGGTLRLLQACRQFEVPYFIFFSSSTVYGENHNNNDILASEDFPPKPSLIKSLGRYAGELMINTFTKSSIAFTIIRPSRIYGVSIVRQYEDITSRFTRISCNGGNLDIHNKGDAKLDFVNLSDVCNFVERIMFSGHSNWNQIYNVGGGHPVSVDELADVYLETASELGVKKPTKNYIKDTPRYNPYCLDISKAQEKLGWTPSTLLKDGVRELMLDYLRLSR